MNAADCRKRAEECSAAAHYASDHEARRAWLQLSDLWLLVSRELVQFRSDATVNAENSKRSVAAAEPTIEDTISGDEKTMEMADRLRLRLSLDEI